MITAQNSKLDRDFQVDEASWLGATARAILLPAAICLGGIAMFWSLPANAQSFNCTNAANAAEFTICNNETLILLDEKLGEKFADKFVQASTSPQRQSVARKQTEWVKKRNACRTDVPCLELRYNERINQLDSRAS